MIEPCRIDHLLALELQPAQQSARPYMTHDFLGALLSRGCSYAVIGPIRPVLCFGFCPWTVDRGCVWSYLDREAGRHMLTIHRYAARFLTTLTGRIYTTVECGFGAGARWVQLLGFDYVDRLPEYGLAKRPHDIYLQERS